MYSHSPAPAVRQFLQEENENCTHFPLLGSDLVSGRGFRQACLGYVSAFKHNPHTSSTSSLQPAGCLRVALALSPGKLPFVGSSPLKEPPCLQAVCPRFIFFVCRLLSPSFQRVIISQPSINVSSISDPLTQLSTEWVLMLTVCRDLISSIMNREHPGLFLCLSGLTPFTSLRMSNSCFLKNLLRGLQDLFQGDYDCF